jgi:hypothetical protein
MCPTFFDSTPRYPEPSKKCSSIPRQAFITSELFCSKVMVPPAPKFVANEAVVLMHPSTLHLECYEGPHGYSESVENPTDLVLISQYVPRSLLPSQGYLDTDLRSAKEHSDSPRSLSLSSLPIECKGMVVWFCSRCGDGPIAMWQYVCTLCGHQRCSACAVEPWK